MAKKPRKAEDVVESDLASRFLARVDRDMALERATERARLAFEEARERGEDVQLPLPMGDPTAALVPARWECVRCGTLYGEELTRDWGQTQETDGYGPMPVCVALVTHGGPVVDGQSPAREVCRGPLVVTNLHTQHVPPLRRR